MVVEQCIRIRYAGLAVGLMVVEQCIRYAGLAVGLMVVEQCIRYAGLAVGLKPSATECEARLRGRERMMYAKTIRPRRGDAKPACAGESGGLPYSAWGTCSHFSWERGHLAHGEATGASRPRSRARGLPQV